MAGRYRGSALRAGILVAAGFAFAPVRAAAEWQIKPFIGLTFGGGTTFTDPEFAAGTAKVAFGFSGLLLGDTIGIEADWYRAPGFFNDSGAREIIFRSSVRTLTGSVVLTLPRRIAEYTLRPYFVGGIGTMHVAWDDNPSLGGAALKVRTTLPAVDIGGGVTGFVSDRIGLSWDVRHFRGIGGEPKVLSSTVLGANERLSFWRANMALAVRF